MAMRRPRVKVAANLAIRRPTKASAAGPSKESKPVIAPIQPKEDIEEPQVANAEEDLPPSEIAEMKRPACKAEQKPVPASSPVAEQSAFKFPSMFITELVARSGAI